MYQTSQNNFGQHSNVKKLNTTIVEIVNKANELINEVTPDYHINTETGAITGKRKRPSLTGEALYEQSQIGYLTLGALDGDGTANYYRNEPFAMNIIELHHLTISDLQERKANLEDPTLPITQYEPINVASSFPDIFVGALAVVLGEKNWIVECTISPNLQNSTVLESMRGGVSCGQMYGSVPRPISRVRATRAEFIESWSHFLNGAPYKSAFAAPAASATNEQPIVEVDNQADEQ